jgi:hypothetical protein
LGAVPTAPGVADRIAFWQHLQRPEQLGFCGGVNAVRELGEPLVRRVSIRRETLRALAAYHYALSPGIFSVNSSRAVHIFVGLLVMVASTGIFAVDPSERALDTRRSLPT